MVKNGGALFRPVAFEFGKIHVSGGYLARPMARVTKTVDDTDGKKKIFVKMAATDNWQIATPSGQCKKN